LRKGFDNIQNLHGMQTLRILQLLLNDKKNERRACEHLRCIRISFEFRHVGHEITLIFVEIVDHDVCLFDGIKALSIYGTSKPNGF